MTKNELLADLRALGVHEGDRMMVHASLRRIGLSRGEVGEGGAERLLDALEAAVGTDGTLVMVLGSHYEMDWVNERPAAQRAGLLAGSAPFVHATAPAMAETGRLAETFRQRPGTILSGNPSGRFGARGARAAELMAGQPWNDYYGPGSPLEKLTEWGGRILRLGANPDTVTALHYAEYLADLPGKRRTRWDYLLADADGQPRHVWIECLDDSKGIADWEGEDYFACILKGYLALGRHAEGRVGKARSELIDAADLVAFGARWMEANLAAPAQAQP